jgi:hypothetical protein
MKGEGGGGGSAKDIFGIFGFAIRWLLHENGSLKKLPCSAAALLTWQDTKSVSEASIFMCAEAVDARCLCMCVCVSMCAPLRRSMPAGCYVRPCVPMCARSLVEDPK